MTTWDYGAVTKVHEAYAEDQHSLACDAINNHIGVLAGVISRMVPGSYEDQVHGDLRELLVKEVECLKKKLQRMAENRTRFCGGDQRVRQLKARFWGKYVSMSQTWKRGYECDWDGTSTEPGEPRLWLVAGGHRIKSRDLLCLDCGRHFNDLVRDRFEDCGT